MAKQIQATRTYLTHELQHEETSAELPEGMELAYDGICFQVDP